MKQPAVLVIEDHPVQRLVIVRALEMLGYTRVLQAQEGSQALEQLALHGVADIVICDVRTPGMDGTQFLRESSQRNLVKSVILSSDVPSDLTAAILHMASLSGIQVLGDLGKPLNLGRLESLLRRYESDSSTAPGNAQTPAEDPPSADEIRVGLDRGEFIPYYQPKFDVRTLQPAGAEVLARWIHPERGLLSPGCFIEAVKDCNELDRMTWALADQAMAQTARSVPMGRGQAWR
ncbi:response regulator [Bordetella holmesii 44057]|nr:response regulator [Bordetella holmesii 44057]